MTTPDRPHPLPDTHPDAPTTPGPDQYEGQLTSRSAPPRTHGKPDPEHEPYHKSAHDAEGLKEGATPDQADNQPLQALREDNEAAGQHLRQQQQGTSPLTPKGNQADDAPGETAGNP